MQSPLTRKERRIILGFAVFGTVIAAFFSLLFKINTNSHGWLAVWSILAAYLFCPAHFVFDYFEVIGEQPLSMSYTVMWVYIGLINCLLYSFLGLLYVAFRQNRIPRMSSDFGR